MNPRRRRFNKRARSCRKHGHVWSTIDATTVGVIPTTVTFICGRCHVGRKYGPSALVSYALTFSLRAFHHKMMREMDKQAPFGRLFDDEMRAAASTAP